MHVTLDTHDLARGGILAALWLILALTLWGLSAQAFGLTLVASTAYAVLLGCIWLLRDRAPVWAGRLILLAGAANGLWLLTAALVR